MLQARLDTLSDTKYEALSISTDKYVSMTHYNGMQVLPPVTIHIQDLTIADIETLLACLSKKRRELIEAQGLVPVEDAEALDS
jgi:hypothetical protein